MAKYTDHTDTIRGNTKQRASTFLRLVCEEVVNISRPKTPRDKGNLYQDVLKQVLGLKGKIEWRKVYAEYQERGSRRDGSRPVRNYTTPGTGPHFAQNAVEKVVVNVGSQLKASHLI